MRARAKTITLTVVALILIALNPVFGVVLQLNNLRSGPEDSTIVEGIIIEASSGAPLASVDVELTDATGRSILALTGSDGKFAITGVPPGTYRFQIKKAGFFTARNLSDVIQIRGVEKRISGITLRMSKGGVIYGRLTDETGLPRSNVRIDALKYTYVNGDRTLAIRGSGDTDDRGEYRLPGLEPGEYLVRATANLFLSKIDAAPTFFPGVSLTRLAVPIKVASGGEYGGITFSLNGTDKHAVKFSIQGGSQNASETVFLYLRSQESNSMVPKSIGKGVFLFENVAPGSYKLYAKAKVFGDPRSRTYYGEATVHVGSEDVDVGMISLRPGVEVSGRISLADSFSGPLKMGPLRVVLSASDGMSAAIDAVVDSEGAFRISDVPIGSFRVALKGLPEGTFLESAAYGLRLMPAFTFEVETEPRSLELRVAASSGLLAGTVRNSSSQGVPMAKIVLIPTQPRRSNPDLFVVASSDQEGLFTIRGIPPGEYDAVAFEQLEPGAERSLEVLSRFENRFLRVSVGRDSSRELSLLAISSSQ